MLNPKPQATPASAPASAPPDQGGGGAGEGQDGSGRNLTEGGQLKYTLMLSERGAEGGGAVNPVP